MRGISTRLVAILCLFASSQAFAIVYEENFSDPFSDWVSEWLYTSTNLQNWYVAVGDCNDNNRGNQPDGIWISDDKVCGSLNTTDPVTINFDPNLGDTASYFSLDAYACGFDVILNIYDKEGALDDSVQIPQVCFDFNNYEFILSNGISAFEFSGSITTIEGFTAIDNVVLDTEGRLMIDDSEPVPVMQSWALTLLILVLLTAGFVFVRRQAS